METFSFAGGMSQMVRALAAEPGIHLRSEHRVLGIEPDARGWRITGSAPDGETGIRARRLVVSTPAPAAARLLAPLDGELTRLLDAIRYAPLAVVHLGLERNAIRHPLDGTGFLVPRRECLGINGNLWLSSLFPGRAPRGRTLLTSYVGGARHPQRADWNDGRLADAVLGDLRPLLGLSATPDYLRVDRHARALPLYHGNYSAHLRALAERVRQWPGLYLAANYQGGVSVRDRIAEGLKTAQRVAASLAQEQTPDAIPVSSVSRVCNGSTV
jgi:oxygen-dependent protoporphyrinogen oxidase